MKDESRIGLVRDGRGKHPRPSKLEPSGKLEARETTLLLFPVLNSPDKDKGGPVSPGQGFPPCCLSPG